MGRRLRTYHDFESLRDDLKRAPQGWEIVEAGYRHPQGDGTIDVAWEDHGGQRTLDSGSGRSGKRSGKPSGRYSRNA